MPLVNCQNCGTKAQVSSFLAAAEQPCGRCGQLLMGTLERSTQTSRPPDFSHALPGPIEHIPRSKSQVALGIVLGAIAGLGIVLFLANFGASIPLHVRGAILGAFTGVLLAPVIAVCLFVYMLVPILNLSLLGVLGDCTWSRISEAVNQRKLGPLLVPFLIFVALPMGLCGLGGSKSKAITNTMHVSAAMGAVALGMVAGGIAANVPRRREL